MVFIFHISLIVGRKGLPSGLKKWFKKGPKKAPWWWSWEQKRMVHIRRISFSLPEGLRGWTIRSFPKKMKKGGPDQLWKMVARAKRTPPCYIHHRACAQACKGVLVTLREVTSSFSFSVLVIFFDFGAFGGSRIPPARLPAQRLTPPKPWFFQRIREGFGK